MLRLVIMRTVTITLTVNRNRNQGTTMPRLSKCSKIPDLESYTCKDCNQKKPKDEFFTIPNAWDNTHQKKRDRCSECRDDYAKRYYEAKVRAKNIANRSLKALRVLLFKIKTPDMSNSDFIKIVLGTLFKQLNEDDADMIMSLVKIEIDTMKHRPTPHPIQPIPKSKTNRVNKFQTIA